MQSFLFLLWFIEGSPLLLWWTDTLLLLNQTWNLAGWAVRQTLPIGLNNTATESHFTNPSPPSSSLHTTSSQNGGPSLDVHHGHLIDSWRDRTLRPLEITSNARDGAAGSENEDAGGGMALGLMLRPEGVEVRRSTFWLAVTLDIQLVLLSSLTLFFSPQDQKETAHKHAYSF